MFKKERELFRPIVRELFQVKSNEYNNITQCCEFAKPSVNNV